MHVEKYRIVKKGGGLPEFCQITGVGGLPECVCISKGG
jgi:hypothetical protein